MVWLVGIDEAGYGPNLGPLVLACTGVRVPEPNICLWELLSPAICRAGTGTDNARIIVDDSKKVYASGVGWLRLERSVFAILSIMQSWSEAQRTLDELLHPLVIPPSREDLADEPWFEGNEDLPIELNEDGWRADCQLLGNISSLSDVFWGLIRGLVIPAQRFNRLLGGTGLKTEVTTWALLQLLSLPYHQLPGDDPIHIFLDKQGGRKSYAALLQAAFPEGWIQTVLETQRKSQYRIQGLTRDILVTIEAEADSHHTTVAISSMLCKYLREVSMRQFNRFWRSHLPEVRPTAGYPIDAARFLREIRPIMAQLGITEEVIWRKK